jgi:hypothetical protein
MAQNIFSLVDAAAPVMKDYYSPERVANVAFRNRPAFAWMPKRTGVVGGTPGASPSRAYVVPLMIDDIAGESASFSAAVDARDGNSYIAWSLDRIKRYATASIDWETVEAMGNDVGSFVRAVTPLVDSSINALGNSIGWGVYRDGTGVRGTLGTYVSGNVLQLAAPFQDARSFRLRGTITASATTGGAVRAGSAKVVAIDIAAGTITVDDATGITGLATGDSLFYSGDSANNASTVFFDGFQSWLPDPTGITTGDDWKGVDRSVYKEKLLGLWFDASTGDIDANVRAAASASVANEASPDTLFLSPTRWNALETALASQSRYEMLQPSGYEGVTGFRSLVINAGNGPINVISDAWCPDQYGYMLQKDTWEMFSITSFPGFVSQDGQRLARLMNEDAVEFRMGGYFNIACKAPGRNLVMDFGVA